MPTKDSFYNIAKELEVAQENEGYLIVIRCGAFFTSIGVNAIALSNELGLKLTCLKKGLCKAGVPIKANFLCLFQNPFFFAFLFCSSFFISFLFFFVSLLF
ncbi:MAG: hypothetical protein KBF09_02900, partial [Clostridia bacterium]|nr:hypothetical protein [Clostridia bacterium]